MSKPNEKQVLDKKIYALFDEDTIRVYQAYNDIIADEAVNLGTFGASFKDVKNHEN